MRVLHDELFYAFHIHHVPALQLLLDFERWKAFCKWLMQQDAVRVLHNEALCPFLQCYVEFRQPLPRLMYKTKRTSCVALPSPCWRLLGELSDFLTNLHSGHLRILFMHRRSVGLNIETLMASQDCVEDPTIRVSSELEGWSRLLQVSE
jgi:hypothetical protein